MSTHPLWRQERLADQAWRAPKGVTQAERATEQNAAAGGRDSRWVNLPGNRRAHGSIALRMPHRSRRIYAYLRWSSGGKTYERYVGEVEQDGRMANLAHAWRLAQSAGLLDVTTRSSTRSVT